jgi:hypothetical protein
MARPLRLEIAGALYHMTSLRSAAVGKVGPCFEKNGSVRTPPLLSKERSTSTYLLCPPFGASSANRTHCCRFSIGPGMPSKLRRDSGLR